MSLMELFQRPRQTPVIAELSLDEKVLQALTKLQLAEQRLSELEADLAEHGASAGLAAFQLMESSVRKQALIVDELKAEYTQLENELGEWRFQEAIRIRKEQNQQKRQKLLADLEAKEKELAGLLEYHRIPFEVRYSNLQSERSAILNELGSIPNE